MLPEQDGKTSSPLTEPASPPEQTSGLLQGPVLRLSTGMHTAPILRLSSDADQRYVVTGSPDKTVRVWELATGRLLRTLRPPMGLGDEGKIYSVALSPDGSTVAAGGATGHACERSYAIYLFDRDSGRLRQRLTGLPSSIQHLAYSRDGSLLVATLLRQGIRLYRTQDYSQVASDTTYGERSLWADFDRTGRLVTSAYDGFVRLYDPTGKLRAKYRVPSSALPHGVAFSPDGARVAVGLSNATSVQILSGVDLTPQHAATAPRDSERHHFAKVAWSGDGKTLYTGGWRPVKGINALRHWADAGQGAATDFSIARHAFSQLTSLQDGRVLFATFDPTFGILDASGQPQFVKSAASVDFRGEMQTFRLSQDGATVQFHTQRSGGVPLRFALHTRVLMARPPEDPSLVPPVTSASGISLTGWQDAFTPAVNGTALKLWPHERALSIALTPDRQRVLLGAEWSLRLCDLTGKELWRVTVPGTTWKVNIAGNGEVAVAAFGDGTIRWYRLRDGHELLALFPHVDRKRWVLWTPDGYYDASPGAEGLIGWHVNRGRDQAADFFRADRFRSTFFRPDIVASALQQRDHTPALQPPNAAARLARQNVEVGTLLPPVLQVLTPSDGATVTTPTVTVRVTVRTPSGEPVTALKALIDGRPVLQTRSLQVVSTAGEVRELQIPIPAHDSEVALIAENRHTASEPVTIKLRWGGVTPAMATQPKLYVLAVGVSQYKNPNLTLGLADKDAQDFATAMQRQQGRMYRTVEVKRLTNGMATKRAILDGFAWLEQQVARGDVAAIFLAGHGVNAPSGEYYFLPTDIDTERVPGTGVSLADFRSTVAAIRGRVLLFVDTCHAGNILWKQGRGTLSVTGAVNDLASAEHGAVVFAAATGNQVSQENVAWGNGAFTKALVEGLEGGAVSSGTGRITFLGLGEYISERVEALTQGQQTPTLTPSPNVPNFPVALAH